MSSAVSRADLQHLKIIMFSLSKVTAEVSPYATPDLSRGHISPYQAHSRCAFKLYCNEGNYHKQVQLTCKMNALWMYIQAKENLKKCLEQDIIQASTAEYQVTYSEKFNCRQCWRHWVWVKMHHILPQAKALKTRAFIKVN